MNYKKAIFLLAGLILNIYQGVSYSQQRDLVKSFADQWEYVGVAIEDPRYHIWGSSPIMDDSGRTHLFAARWSAKIPFDKGWRSHSEIAHYVSDHPEGPFKFIEVVLKGSGRDTWDKYGIHNPAIHKVSNQYILLYIANNNFTPPYHPANQQIGMLISNSLYGPWRKVGKDGLVLSPSTNLKHWTYNARNGVCNPALLQHPNGGFFLYFKSQGGKMGVAFADKIDGPYVMFPTPITQNDYAIEDGYAFVYENQICLLTTDNHGIIKKGGGLLWRSRNGIDFEKPELGFHLFEEYLKKEQQQHVKRIYGYQIKFERPQILMKEGQPAYLYLPSGANINGNSGTASYILGNKDFVGLNGKP